MKPLPFSCSMEDREVSNAMTLQDIAALWAQPTADGRIAQPKQVEIIRRAIAKLGDTTT